MSENGDLHALSGAPRIFDRQRHRHRWETAFTELEKSAVFGHAQVVENWRMDPRVSPEREQVLLDASEFADPAPDGGTWQAQRGKYFGRALCRPSREEASGLRSAYLEPVNAGNRLTRRHPNSVELLHVASLDRWIARLSGAQPLSRKRRRRFREIVGLPFPERPPNRPAPTADELTASVDGIAKALDGRADAVRELAELLCDGLGVNEPPWWATFAHDLEPVLRRESGAELCRRLGLGHLNQGEHLFVWRYPVERLTLQGLDLWRPTVIEANDSPWHFSSPPGAAYGITMPLGAPKSRACREVLHAPLRGADARETCLGTLWRVEEAPVGYDQVSELRRRHRSRLEKDQPSPDTSAWLARHPPRS